MNAKETPSASTSFSVPVPCFSVSFLLQRPFLFWSALFSFFCSPFPVPPFSSFCFLVQPLFLFFLVHVLPFFSPKTFLNPKHFSVQPKTFFSLAQNIFFFFQFSHSSLLLFSALFFSGSALFFLFQRLLFFFSLAPFIQDPMFSLAASHLFYLNNLYFLQIWNKI